MPRILQIEGANSSTVLDFRVNNSSRLVLGSSGQIGLSGQNYGISNQVIVSQGTGAAAVWSLISNSNISATASIAYSKLNLTNSILNADIGSSAAIVDTKLATISSSGKVLNSATSALSTNTANAIVTRDSNGDFESRRINLSYIISSDDTSTSAPVTFIMSKKGDNFIRSTTAAQVATFLSGQTMNIAGSSTSCTGDSATVGGLPIHSGRNNVANRIVRTDSSGYIQAGYINSDSGYNENNASIPDRIWGSNAGGDSYLRAYQTSYVQTRFMSTSHLGSNFYLTNNWNGTYWRITSNHGSPVSVGHADSATQLLTARTINGVSFNGTQNITITATPTNYTVVRPSLSGDLELTIENTEANLLPITGKVKGVVVLRGGSGYTSAPTVTIGTTSGRPAIGVAVISGGAVTAVNITEEGTDYTEEYPTITFSGGGGTGAYAVGLACITPYCYDDASHGRAGDYCFYGIGANDSIKIAGYNRNYNLGVGVQNHEQNTPTEIFLHEPGETTSSKPVQIYTSADSVYVIDNQGRLWSCGYNGYSQLGRGWEGYSWPNTVFKRVNFSGGGIVRKFATNYSGGYSGATTCMALVENGSGKFLYGWGYNGHGALGDNTNTNRSTPQLLSQAQNLGNGETYDNIVDIVVGGRSSHGVCAVLFNTGRVRCAGYNGQAQLSRGNTSTYYSWDYAYLSASNPLTNVVEISGGDSHYSQLYFRTSTGWIYSSGYGAHGVMGNGTNNSTSTYMAAVSGGGSWATGSDKNMFASGGHTTGVVWAYKNDGSLWRWGYSGHGELAIAGGTYPTPSDSGYVKSQIKAVRPFKTEGETGAIALLLNDGRILVAGYNGYGNLGVGYQDNNFSFGWCNFPPERVKDIHWINKQANTFGLGILTKDGHIFTTSQNDHGCLLRGAPTGYRVATPAKGRL